MFCAKRGRPGQLLFAARASRVLRMTSNTVWRSLWLVRTQLLRKSKMKIACLLSLLIVLLISGCAGISYGAGEGKADAVEGGSNGMSSEVIPELAGSWKLVSFHIEDPSGKKTYPFGKDAQGRLIYEPGGRMAVQLMDPNRPGFASGDPLVTSEAEVRAAFGGYTAYYGTYWVNPGEGTIVHHIEASLLPNWVGTSQKRLFEFDGKYLTLKGPLLIGGVQGVVSLVWERLPRGANAIHNH